jgi:hypothetical protein
MENLLDENFIGGYELSFRSLEGWLDFKKVIMNNRIKEEQGKEKGE